MYHSVFVSVFVAIEIKFKPFSAKTIGVPVGNAIFGSNNETIWLDDVICSGKEKDLGQCAHKVLGHSNCDHDEDAGVICAPSSGR